MTRSKLKVGDWVRLTHGYCGCRIGQLLEVPGDYGGEWLVATDSTGDVKYNRITQEMQAQGLLCVRNDIHSRAKGPPHAYFPMRKRLPYGRYIRADGSYVLHNRDYEPIVRVTGSNRSPCEPSEWIEHV